MRILRICWRSSGKFRVGVIILGTLIALALLAPLIYRPIIGDVSPARPGMFSMWQPPSAAHPLGTDGHGRDLLTNYLAGLRTSLIIGFAAGLLATLVGIVVGFIAGYKGGMADAGLTTTANMFLVIPSYPILVALAMILPTITLTSMVLILALFSWPFSARLIRAQVSGMKQQPYIDLAIVSGQSDLRITFTEILPNLIPYLLMGFAFSTVGAMVAEVGLEVIGLGPSDIITLGMLIFFSNQWGTFSRGRPDLVWIPVILLVLIFMSITLINRGMEEYTNPRLQQVTGK